MTSSEPTSLEHASVRAPHRGAIGVGIIGLGFMGRTHLASYARTEGCEVRALLDPAHLVVAAVGASISPEAALIRFNADGGFDLLYRGRINDLYLGPTKRQRAATTNDLRNALDAILSAKPVPSPQHEAQGCKISGLN
jgi:hypothetical protein